MKKLSIDLWYGNTLEDCDKMDCYFSDCDCVYRGSFYKNGKIVGDFTSLTLQAIENTWLTSHNIANLF